MGSGHAVLLYTCLASQAFAQASISDRSQAFQRAQALESLGKQMFFDASLSASGKLSCASCHDPALAYGPPNAFAVQLGGISGRASGIRAVPSLRYLQANPHFTEHGFEEETMGADGVDNGPTGGLTWDGRVDRGRQQARIPLLSPYEMANSGETSVVAKALKAPYSDQLLRLSIGLGVQPIFETILEAFESWEENDQEFYPYNSQYDLWLAGRANLSPSESRGLRLFTDPDKGNCARCHIATRGINGTPPQFTDYGLVALGVPRNTEIPANADPAWHDLGMCGPERTDLSNRAEYCGRFMTPSLRNVATRKVFFHNGVVHSLREAVKFYVDRGSGQTKFDDLPFQYRVNLDQEPPFNRAPGRQPVLTDQDIDDIVSFLRTLTDGFQVTH
jgi:cytochrome c peroxidase